MRIPSGSTDRYIYIYAVDENDKSTPETGKVFGDWTVYRARDGGTPAAMTITSGDVTEVDATNMPGVYEFLVNEDTTIGASHDTEEMVFHFICSGVQTIVRSIELYRPKATEGETIGASSGAVSNVTTVATTTTNTDMRGTDSALLAASAPTNFSDLAITVTTGQVTVGTNNDKTGYSISGTKTTLDALNDVSTAQVNTEVDTALADYDPPTKAEMDAGFAALNDPTAAAVADAVWDETITGHATSNTFGRALWVAGAIIQDTTATGTPTTTTLQLSAGSTFDDYYNDLQIVPKDGNANGQARIVTDYVGATKTITIDEAWSTAPSADDAILIRAIHNHTITQLNTEIADSVLDEALSGHTTAGSLGKAVADIEVDTQEIGTAGAGLTDLGGMSTAMKAEVNAEADTALTDYGPSTHAATDIVSAGAITTSGGAVSTVTAVTNRVTANTDQIAGDATAATRLSASALGIVSTAVNDASATTTSFITDLTEATDDHYNGRIIVFTSGALDGQATDITDYTGATKTVTVTALTEAPADNDTFVIL